jgi:diguanylate cyclase (GGDEF)-like protein
MTAIKDIDYASADTLRDIERKYEALKRDNEQLESLVKMDSLTSVLNRRGLESVLTREIEYAKRNKTKLLAVMIDLDDFKRVNDTLGHFAGDLVLKHVASVLKQSVRAIDWVGRVGGDEFVILLPGTSLTDAVKVAERIRCDLSSKSFPLVDGEIRQTASLGVIQLPLNVCSIEEILELTKSSLKDSKERGKDCVSFGEGGCLPQQKKFTEVTLREVLLNESARQVVVQPIVHLSSRKEVGYEILTRGPAPDFEQPEKYFRACLESNLLTLVDLQCFSASLERSRCLPSDTVCYLNLFPSALVEVPIENLIQQLTWDAGGGRTYCLEISERHIKSLPDFLVEPLAQLRAAGVRIGLDDVGYGHSSLEAIFAIMPDVMKIDGRLTYKISSNRRNQLIIAKLKRFADSLGSEIIAEGVETEEDAHTLKHIGIDYGQGWFTGRVF